ncbi:putative ribonuclease H-like domain-containing protein [Tanacetum coccineum]
MPPRRFKKKSVKRIVEKRVAKAIEEYEKTRTDSNNTGGSGSANTGGTLVFVTRCAWIFVFRTLNELAILTLSTGMKAVVGLKTKLRWGTFLGAIGEGTSSGVRVLLGAEYSVLGKFDGKSDEGFLVGYSLNSKAYRVYNLVTKRVEVNLHVNFLEDKPNVKGVGYRWMFDIDYLTDSMNYIPVSLENQANPHAGASEVTNNAGTSQTPYSNASEEKDEDVELIVVPSAVKNTKEKVKSRTSSTNSKKEEILTEPQQEKKASSTDTSEDNPKILAFRRELEEIALKHLGTSQIFHKSETGIFDEASYDEEGVITDFNSLPTEIKVSPTPTLRIHNIHPKSQILGDPKSAVQTRRMWQQNARAHAFSTIFISSKENNHKDHNIVCLPIFYLRKKPKKIFKALQDDSWVQAMQEELLQFKLQQEGRYWTMMRFCSCGRIEAIRWSKLCYGLHQVLELGNATLSTFLEKLDTRGSTKKSWCDEFEALMKSRFQMSSMGELTFFLGLQVKQNKAGIFISQDKYVAEILKKFDLVNVKTAITPMETKVALTKDEEAVDVDVTPKTSHLNAVKRIFKYLKGKPNLGLWYPRESPFDLEAFFDSDYGGSNLDRKSTTEKDKRVLLSDSEEEEIEARGRKFHDLDPLVSLLQELITPSKTPSKTVNALGEEQVEDIIPTTLEAAAILTKVKKIKSVDKSIKVSTGIEEINAGSLDVNTGSDPVTTDSIRVSVPSPDSR